MAASMNLVQLIQDLQEQQEQHAAATVAIAGTLAQQQDQQQQAADAIADTLGQISAMLSALLGGGVAVAPKAAAVMKSKAPSLATPKAPVKSGNGPAKVAAPAAKSASQGKKSTGGGRTTSKFATTASESVLAFVRQKTNPTTAELTKYWKSEGRGGKVDNTLGDLVRGGTLLRLPNESGRGSRYALA